MKVNLNQYKTKTVELIKKMDWVTGVLVFVLVGLVVGGVVQSTRAQRNEDKLLTIEDPQDTAESIEEEPEEKPGESYPSVITDTDPESTDVQGDTSAETEEPNETERVRIPVTTLPDTSSR